ncbi:MAG: hypothetical protein WCJ30_00685 [Deltaproteobacteria bacterium]
MSSIPAKPTSNLGWKVEDAAQLYQVDSWGGGYFGANAAGHRAIAGFDARAKLVGGCWVGSDAGLVCSKHLPGLGNEVRRPRHALQQDRDLPRFQ